MSAVEPLGSYDAETQSDVSRVEGVRLVDPLGPISPELVLVDPRLAAQARAMLPDAEIGGLPQRRELILPVPAVTGSANPAPSRSTIPWKLAVMAAVAVAVIIGLRLWTTVLGNDFDPSPQLSAKTEPAFFTTRESEVSPDEVAALERAVRLDPRSPLARETLGTAYFRLGRWRDAEGEFRALVKLSPADKFAHYALGRALGSQGRQREAALQLDLAGSLSKEASSVDPASR